MRLSEHDVRVVKDAIRRRFGQEAEVFLFGSRVDDVDVVMQEIHREAVPL
jgi:hypothetical protein